VAGARPSGGAFHGRLVMPLDWDKLRVFHAVAEAGSFTHAGETLNLSQSAVSRQIQSLEDALSVPLFHRHARGLILTESGETLNRTVREVFAKLAMAEALLTESRERPAGRLKVTCTTGFGSTWLAPRLGGFLTPYPDISVTLLLDDTDLDLAMREADVAIRMHPPRQPDLIQRHLASFGWRVCGAPSYLKTHGMPERAEELDRHRLIVWGDHRPPIDQVNWLAEIGRRAGAPRRAVIEVNSLTAMLRAVQSGLGLAALPDYMGRELDGLLPVLAEVKGPRLDAYFVYPEEMRHSKRVSVFRDFMVAELAAAP
jgi:DNA-binding transcriptional LysR family regulator